VGALFLWKGHTLGFLATTVLAGAVAADPTAEDYENEIKPLLEAYCFDCHGDGSSKGDFSLDEFENLGAHLKDHESWLAIWQNLRSQIMPPAKEDQPEDGERRQLMKWIEGRVFLLDPKNLDPGRVTIRRLNRVEYKNTIRDLVGVDFDVRDNFPPDDTGYGFDTIGDVLSLSPLLMEKYLEASEVVMAKALPENAAEIPVLKISAGALKQKDKPNQTGRHMEFEVDHTVESSLKLAHEGNYRVRLDFAVEGSMEATSHTATVALLVDGKELKRQKVGWDYRKMIRVEDVLPLGKGRHRFAVHLIPEMAPKKGEHKLGVAVQSLTVRGPMEGGWNTYPDSYRRLLFEGLAPDNEEGRRLYAARIFRRFVTRAYRRPVDAQTVARLVEMAMAVDGEDGKLFEDGIRQALTAVLSSPRFLFRAEVQSAPDDPKEVVALDEYTLASRLSYFLWSSLPDEELMALARDGKLRENLRAQVDRMLGDLRARRFARNFTGQWMQARDVEGIHINASVILGVKKSAAAGRIFNGRVRREMREETEQFFLHVLQENLPVMDLINADYTFLNERLAAYYNIEGVEGEEFRRVDLNPESRRGGLLTQGTFLVVTSNPSRTSPVKRGLFVLDNILGTPAPPAPADVPELEETKRKNGQKLTMREQMIRHRSEPLCKSCHARMDPIGLALENFNALGLWRETDGGKPLDTAGVLITGEEFGTVAELKEILATSRRKDFLRCLTEKMLTYAIGRGTEYYDAPTIDAIVERLETEQGLREVIYGIVESVPFQMRRGG